MKTMKMYLLLSTAIMLALILSACSNNGVDVDVATPTALGIAADEMYEETAETDSEPTYYESHNNVWKPVEGSIPLEKVIEDPGSFIGTNSQTITLSGFAADISPRFFYITNYDRSAYLMIDFRGSSAFPQADDEIIISGFLTQNCCDPDLIMLTAMNFSFRD